MGKAPVCGLLRLRNSLWQLPIKDSDFQRNKTPSPGATGGGNAGINISLLFDCSAYTLIGGTNMKKYELISETKMVCGITLHRIRALMPEVPV